METEHRKFAHSICYRVLRNMAKFTDIDDSSYSSNFVR